MIAVVAFEKPSTLDKLGADFLLLREEIGIVPGNSRIRF
jgi:hypothetical protein